MSLHAESRHTSVPATERLAAKIDTAIEAGVPSAEARTYVLRQYPRLREQLVAECNAGHARSADRQRPDGRAEGARRQWETAVQRIAAELSCSTMQARSEARRRYPDLHRRLIQESNAGNPNVWAAGERM